MGTVARESAHMDVTFRAGMDYLCSLMEHDASLHETWIKTEKELKRLVEILNVINSNLKIDGQFIRALKWDYTFMSMSQLGGNKLEPEDAIIRDLSEQIQGIDEEREPDPDTVEFLRQLVVPHLIRFGKTRKEKEGDMPFHREELAVTDLALQRELLEKDNEILANVKATRFAVHMEDKDPNRQLRLTCVDMVDAREKLIRSLEENKRLLAKFSPEIQHQIRRIQLQIAKGEKPFLAAIPLGAERA